jgi:phosphoadenosine phosphosulfate reductase
MSQQQITELQLQQWVDHLSRLSPEAVLRWAQATFGDQVAMATSLGAEDQVLTAMVAEATPTLAIFSLDTGRLFQESYELWQLTEKTYGLRIRQMFPNQAAVETMVREHGINLFYDSVENRKLCCGVRKIEPLRRALSGLKAWITGLRREQSVTRESLPVVQWDAANGLIKINPLWSWTQDQVWDYIKARQVPYNSLHDKGFLSIGCASCTRAVKPGEDLRAGRWWWENPEQKECGLHLVNGKLVRITKPQ